MQYKVRLSNGEYAIAPDLQKASSLYCNGKYCSDCRLSREQKGCTNCDYDDLIRRFGDDLEIIDDETQQEEQKHDAVSHPAHYTAGGIECIDAIAAALSSHKNPMEAWLTGQVLKYLWRWPLKNGVEDLRKAQWYLDRLIEKAGGEK